MLLPHSLTAAEPHRGATTVATGRRPPAVVAKLPRATSDRATAGDRILSPPSLFSIILEPPSRPEPPAQATAGEPTLPLLFFGREEGEEGKFAQSPLACFLFI